MTDYELALQYWNNKGITNGAELAEALNGHGIAFAYNSGKIENDNITYNDTREIFEHDGVTSYTGEYKHHDYVTGREEIGASPEDVEEEMSELMSEMQDVDDSNALTAAAYFHVKIENIHPFADGNGR